VHFQDKSLGGAIACTAAEATLLYLAARCAQPEAPIEIGSYIGWSTAHLASGIKSVLTCIDPFLEIGPDLREDTSEPAKQRFLDNLTRAGLIERIRLVCGKSPEAIPTAAPGGWDFAFVDGWHVDGQPIRDVSGITPHLAPTAVVILHDLWLPDVRDALCYLRALGWEYEILNTSNYLTLAWRIRPPWLTDFLSEAKGARFVNTSAALRVNRVVKGLTAESIETCATVFGSRNT